MDKHIAYESVKMSSYLDKLKFTCFGCPPRRIIKAVRRLNPKRKSSIQFGTTSLFQNVSPLTDEIEKSSASNKQPVALSERFPEINIINSKPKVYLNENASNILRIENFLFSTFFQAHSNISEWNSIPKILKKVVEIHEGKRFVRMECIIECNLDISEQHLSKTCVNDVSFEYSRNNLISEYNNQNSSCNFLCQDKFHTIEKDLVSPNSIISSQYEFNFQLPSCQNTNVLSKFTSNAKVEPTKMYQICLVLKDEPVSYFWESASEEFKHDTEFVFDVEHRSISYPITYEKAEDYDKSNVDENHETNFNKKTLLTESEVPDLPEDVCKMMSSIYGEIRKCKDILDSLKETTELIKKEFSFHLMYPNADVTDGLSAPEEHRAADFEQRDFSDSYVKSFEENGSISLNRSLDIQYSIREMNELAKSLGSQRSAFETENYESLKHLDALTKATQNSFLCSSLLEENSQDNSVDVHCTFGNFQNESEEEDLLLPFASRLLLLDSILLNLQVTYDVVEKEVRSWLPYSETDQSDFQVQHFWNNTSCRSVRTLAYQQECFGNNNYIMKFKGRNTDTIVGKYSEWLAYSSDSDALSLPGVHDPESDLDDSESSLEGSFKQHGNDSYTSMISSDDDDDDDDDILRFSLPSRTLDDPKFCTKKSEICDAVSSREWSLKNAETKMSSKCTNKGRRFRSEKHCMREGLGNPKDFLPEDFGIPGDRLQDFNRVTSPSENFTNVEHEGDVHKCSS